MKIKNRNVIFYLLSIKCKLLLILIFGKLDSRTKETYFSIQNPSIKDKKIPDIENRYRAFFTFFFIKKSYRIKIQEP